MNVITSDMDDAMRRQGFVRKKKRWRRSGDDDLPVQVYQEQATHTANLTGFTVLFGWPGRDPEQWGCFQLSQGEVCGRGSHYYDLGSVAALERIQDDFLRFTAPLAGRFSTGVELAGALEARLIPASDTTRGDVGLVIDLLDISAAHSLRDVEARALALARALAADSLQRKAIEEASEFDERIRRAVESIAPPVTPSQRRWPWQR